MDKRRSATNLRVGKVLCTCVLCAPVPVVGVGGVWGGRRSVVVVVGAWGPCAYLLFLLIFLSSLHLLFVVILYYQMPVF